MSAPKSLVKDSKTFRRATPEAINTAYTARFSSAMLDNDTLGVLAGL
ncbi:MAG: hypothetical protein AB7E24_00170 [Novosphingobium sp.]